LRKKTGAWKETLPFCEGVATRGVFVEVNRSGKTVAAKTSAAGRWGRIRWAQAEQKEGRRSAETKV